MTKPFKQVLWSYLCRPFTSWLAALLTTMLTLVGVVGLFAFLRRPTGPPFIPLIFPCCYLFGFIFIHAKQQWTNPRARLTPGFRWPHLLAPMLLVASAAGGFPVLRMLVTGNYSLGTPALFVAWAAVIAWWVLQQSGLITILALAAWFAMFSPPGERFLTDLCTGRQETLAVVLLAAGLAGLGAAFTRLATLNEEMPAYHRRMHGHRGWTSGQFAAATHDPFALKARGADRWYWLMSTTDRRLRYLRQNAGRNTLWHRVNRWRAPTMISRRLAFVATFMMLPQAVMLFMTSSAKDAFFPMSIWVVMIPTMFAGGMWLQQRQFLPRIALWPVERAVMLRELGLSLALDCVVAWAWFTVCWLALVAVAHFNFNQQQLPNILLFLSLSALIQVFFFGLVVWCLRYRSIPMLFIFLIVGGIGGFGASTFVIETRFKLYEPYLLVGGTIVLALAGILVARDAYRRWLVTDLE